MFYVLCFFYCLQVYKYMSKDDKKVDSNKKGTPQLAVGKYEQTIGVLNDDMMYLTC